MSGRSRTVGFVEARVKFIPRGGGRGPASPGPGAAPKGEVALPTTDFGRRVLVPGDRIGPEYEVRDKLGEGGFGRVYLVRSLRSGRYYAVKTLRDRFSRDPEVRARFRAEANVWVDMGAHPNIVQATFVSEYDHRLYIGLELIEQDDQGRVSLEDHLTAAQPELEQSLRWAVDCCRGLEYAYSKGIHAHRDLKPSNILIDHQGRARITDFGLAGVMGSELEGQAIGSMIYMPPEQFDDVTSCDERSDLYSFGIVLYRMANPTGSPPFYADAPGDENASAWRDFWHQIFVMHARSPVPVLDSPLQPMLARLLAKAPADRYGSFAELRADLEGLLREIGADVVASPELAPLSAAQWAARGSDLSELGRYKEALDCCDRAIDLDAESVTAWQTKGRVLKSLGRHAEALEADRRIVEIDPANRDGWVGVGVALASLGRYEEAVAAYDRAIEIDRKFVYSYFDRGLALLAWGRPAEALADFGRTLEINPRFGEGWVQSGRAMAAQGRHKEAIAALDKGLQLSPGSPSGWRAAGNSFRELGSHRNAADAFERALELDPSDSASWLKLGQSLITLGLREDALTAFQKFTDLKPEVDDGWLSLGKCLGTLHRYRESAEALDRALKLSPNRPILWALRGDALKGMNMQREALNSYHKAVQLDPSMDGVWMVMATTFAQLGDRANAAACLTNAEAIKRGVVPPKRRQS
jgi:tetratricopeptide (TPR) repeat protein